MNPPEWEDILGEPFVALILGQRGSGKTALGHRLLEIFGQGDDRDAYILGFPDHLRDRLPDWIEVLPPETGRDSWPADSVVLVHEAHQLLHARRSMDAANVDIDELVTVSRHRNSDIIFETQQSQRLDRNSVTAVDAIILREPALMQADFERKQMKPIVRAAEEVFEQYNETIDTGDYVFREKSDEVKKHAYIHSGRFVGEYPHDIVLADYWTEDISKAYSEVSEIQQAAGVDSETLEMIDAIAEWEMENRPFDYEFQGVKASRLGFHPSTVATLQNDGLAVNVEFSNNQPNAYRLTEDGWEASSYDEEDAPDVGAA